MNNNSKRFTLSRHDKKIGGVCGGIAEYFNIDTTLIRIIFLIFLFTGCGLLAYLFFWICAPAGE